MTETLPKLVLEQVKPEYVGKVAKAILPLVEKACAYSGGRFSPDNVFEACAGLDPARKWYLWIVFDPHKADVENFADRVKAVTVTALVDYPTGLRMGETILIGGNGSSDEWLNYIDDLRDWAKKNGASRMQYVGRRGWQRHMKPLGIEWKPVSTMFECELEDENGR